MVQFFLHRESAPAGGIIRDVAGMWLCGFTLSFGLAPIFQVEARAMYGLWLAWDGGHRRVELECDNSLLVEIILAGGVAASGMVELWLLHDLMIHPWVVHLRHIPRVQNSVADASARLVNPTMTQFNVMEVPPLSIKDLFLEDFNLSGWFVCLRFGCFYSTKKNRTKQSIKLL